MKKILFMMSVLASLFITGCSQEEVTPPGSEDDGGSNTSYMAVNLISSDPVGSRATYEDGSIDENHVKKVRFYFFNAAGAAVNVKLKGSTYVNYYDWTPNTAADDDYNSSEEENPDQSGDGITGNDIESKLNAVIVINTSSGDKVPQRIAAVLNPPTTLGDESKGLPSLKEEVEDFAASGFTKKGAFVMFNAVGGNGTDFSTTLIENKNLCKTEEQARNNPVTIYVERSVAKVSVALNFATDDVTSDGKIKLKYKKENPDDPDKYITVGGDQVYLKLDGWSLTAETSEGRLIKKVNKAWDGTWWYATYRSFWAINALSATNRYFNYNAIGTSFGGTNAMYTNENAQPFDGDTQGAAKEKTKVIIKGQLCKADGSAFTIVRHLGVYFADTPSKTESANLPELKKSILNQLAASKKFFSPKADGSGRDQIDADDIKILVAPQQSAELSKNNCYVYAQLTDAAKGKTWYTSETGTETATSTTINTALANTTIVDRALVWNSGMTYYYYPIKHLNADPAGIDQLGVVRNHVYKTTVTKIAGLGTPVYDPKEVIYPEKPEDNDHYIAAEINILSWRLVTNNYELEW